MATALISVEEYLRTAYEPDAEYVDGVIEERFLGEDGHGAWQIALGYYFHGRRRELGIRVRSELRTKISERRYRIPDIAVIDAALPKEPVALTPFLIAIEILSPEDRLSRLIVRLADFEAMGVPAIYIIDPADNSLVRFQAGKFQNVDTLLLRDMRIPFADILADLD